MLAPAAAARSNQYADKASAGRRGPADSESEPDKLPPQHRDLPFFASIQGWRCTAACKALAAACTARAIFASIEGSRRRSTDRADRVSSTKPAPAGPNQNNLISPAAKSAHGRRRCSQAGPGRLTD